MALVATVVTFGALMAGLGRRVVRVEVEGASMEPALQAGDRLLAFRGLWTPPGAVVVALDPRDPGRPLVKRVAVVDAQGAMLLGDDPEASTDSRHFGPVPRVLLRGRVVWRYGPPERRGPVRRCSTTNPGTVLNLGAERPISTM